MKTALITGVTGQDGFWLSKLLLEKGYKVVGVARRSSSDNTTRLVEQLKNSNFKLVQGDVTDLSSVISLLSAHCPQEIYNLAAQSHVGTSFSQPLYTTDATYLGCLNLLEAMRMTGSEAKFYQASSSEMFGDQFTTHPVCGKYQDENTPFKPQSPYSIAKLAAHHAVNLYRQSYGLFACSGILFNHESEHRGDLFVTKKIAKWIGSFREVQNTAKLSLGSDYDGPRYFDSDTHKIGFDHNWQCSFPKLRLGNLSASRDWGHSEDYVRAMHLMLQKDEPDDYVIGTGITYTVQDFLEEAFTIAGLEDWENYVVIDKDLFRPSEVPYLCARPTKAKEQLGWKPEINFKQLVKRMVEHETKKA